MANAVKFHLNPTTGMAGPCKSTEGKCPFGDESEHYSSVEEAQAAYEQSMADETVAPIVSKPKPKPRTVVPAPEYSMVEGTALGEKVNVGDTVNIRGTNHEVLERKIGYKYNTVTIAGGKNGTREVNLPLEEEVKVQVRTETDESKAARNEASRELDYEWAVLDHKPASKAIANLILEDIERGETPGHHTGDLAQASAKDLIMSEFKEKIAHVRANESTDFPHNRALELLKEDYRDQILEASSRTGRYTNPGQDLFVRAELEAKARFLKHPYFY